MNRVLGRRTPSGFTLIELLCVMAIITILAALVMGPASRALGKARALRWANDAEHQLDVTVAQLQNHFQGRLGFPLVTLRYLETNGVVGSAQLRFLKDRRVTFIPFASTDPDAKVVIQVRLERGFLIAGGVWTATKGRITKPPE